jgi:hypothetical protein
VAPGQRARCWVKMSTVSEETREVAQTSEVAFDAAAEIKKRMRTDARA